MSTGDFDDAPGNSRALAEAYKKYPAIGAFMGEEHHLDHAHDVPYIGGISADGKTYYLDRHVPEKIGKIPVKLLIRVHETFEYSYIRELARRARVRHWQDHAHRFYEQAHHLATAAEKVLLDEMGIIWKTYTEALRPYYKPVDHENLTKPPHELSLYPYSGQLYRLLWDFRRGKVAKATVNYRPGNSEKSCGTCSMYLTTVHACSLVAGTIRASDVCNKWEPAHDEKKAKD